MMGVVSIEFTLRCCLWVTVILEGVSQYFPWRLIQGLVKMDIFINDPEYEVEIMLLVCRWCIQLVSWR